MSSTIQRLAILLVIVMILTAQCDAKRKKLKKYQNKSQIKSKQAKEFELRETNPPNFLRLLVMRLVYGLAAQLNMEERVSGWFNGAFVPPNADYDDYGFGDLGAEALFDA